MSELQARLMTCHRGSEDKDPSSAGGYMPIEPYEILNADETVRALIATIHHTARNYEREQILRLKAEEDLRLFKMKQTLRYSLKYSKIWIRTKQLYYKIIK